MSNTEIVILVMAGCALSTAMSALAALHDMKRRITRLEMLKWMSNVGNKEPTTMSPAQTLQALAPAQARMTQTQIQMDAQLRALNNAAQHKSEMLARGGPVRWHSIPARWGKEK